LFRHERHLDRVDAGRSRKPAAAEISAPAQAYATRV